MSTLIRDKSIIHKGRNSIPENDSTCCDLIWLLCKKRGLITLVYGIVPHLDIHKQMFDR